MLMLWPPGTIRNLASCVMAANLRRLSADVAQRTSGIAWSWPKRSSTTAQFVGTMLSMPAYWIFVGRTRGFARSNGRYTDAPRAALQGDVP